MRLRRIFLKTGGILSAGTACASALPLLPICASKAGSEEEEPGGCKYGMVIDLTKCKDGCTECVSACNKENNVGQFEDKKWNLAFIRKVTVERVFPVHSPKLEKIELTEQGRHNRAKLYYLRGLRGKAARQKVRRRT